RSRGGRNTCADFSSILEDTWRVRKIDVTTYRDERSIIWDAVDEKAIERDVDEGNPITIGRVRVQTSSGSGKMTIWGELSTAYADEERFG
ncbi:hypothetical protein ACFOZ7_19115, partial [Natribaculum luteum]